MMKIVAFPYIFTTIFNLAQWSRGKILALCANGPGIESRPRPMFFQKSFVLIMSVSLFVFVITMHSCAFNLMNSKYTMEIKHTK